METNEEKKTQERKKYSARGERGQKMVAFRLDLDLTEWLEKQANKGRYINNLIRTHMDDLKMKRWSNDIDEHDPLPDRHDWQP